ncbi:hypothetical protein [Streptomyces sp. NPDC056240]|uniref:hypothetical protein n=1 Tax=Streptomyces sp. NPDC056240 TaxID=3345759 RepID=UPI0035E1D158
MHPQLIPSSPGHDAVQRQREEILRVATRRTQRVFVIVNAVPLAVSTLVFPFTDIPAVPLLGHLTLGLVWGILQCVLFVATTWWHETRSTRPCGPSAVEG